MAGGLDESLFVMFCRMCANGEVFVVEPGIGTKLIVEPAGNARRLARSKTWQKLGGIFDCEFDISVESTGGGGVLSGVEDAPIAYQYMEKSLIEKTVVE